MPNAPTHDRLANRERVLRAILREGALARVALAQHTGLTTAAISNITRDLIEDRLLEEVGTAHDGRVGAHPILLDFSSATFLVGVVHQGVSSLRVGLCNLRGQLVARHIIRTESRYSPDWAVERVATTLAALLSEGGYPQSAMVGVCFGAIGLVDVRRGLSKRAHSLGWQGVPLRDLLERRLGCPVVVENNVRAMAIGEALLGAGRAQPNFAFVYVGSGVGSGLVIDGRPYRGAYGGAGELGHITVDPAGPVCMCGNRGCLEAVAAEPAILLQAQQRGLLHDLPAGISIKDAMRALLARCADGSEAAREIISGAGESLGVALADLMNLLNPGQIVLHGVITDAGQVFFSAIERTLHQRAFLAAGETVTLGAATFGEDAGLVGAAAVALDALIFSRGGVLDAAPTA